MNHLLREKAPISDAAWAEITDVSGDGLISPVIAFGTLTAGGGLAVLTYVALPGHRVLIGLVEWSLLGVEAALPALFDLGFAFEHHLAVFQRMLLFLQLPGLGEQARIVAVQLGQLLFPEIGRAHV